MPFNILIIEDSINTASLMRDYLSDHLHRVAREQPTNVDPLGRTYTQGSGFLPQLTPSFWPVLHPEDIVVRRLEDNPTEDPGYQPISDLISGGLGRDLIRTLTPICEREFGPRVQHPDLLIVDMALSSNEQESLTGPGRSDPDNFELRVLVDPRGPLQDTTGFKLLEAFASQTPDRLAEFGEAIPVIAMSYARNPLVAQHCLLNRACAFVRKPLHDKVAWENEQIIYVTSNGYEFDVLETGAAENLEKNHVVVAHFLTVVAAEVLKAMVGVVARRLGLHVAPQLARDLAFSRGQLAPRQQVDTGVSLIAAPWLRELVRIENVDTPGLFSLCSELWTIVQAELDAYAGNIDYVLGGSVFAFHGVHARPHRQEDAASLARCVARLPNLFARGGAPRAHLISRIEHLEHDPSLGTTDREAVRDRLRAFLEARPLEMLVIAVWVPGADGLYGLLSTGHRQFHTTLASSTSWLGAVLEQQSADDGGRLPALYAVKKGCNLPDVGDLDFVPVVRTAADSTGRIPIPAEFDLYQLVLTG